MTLGTLDADAAPRDPSAGAPRARRAHTALERGLIERSGRYRRGQAGPVAQRPDRDINIRAYLRQECQATRWTQVLDSFWDALLVSQSGVRGGMPGRTHMQHAQPVLVVTTRWPRGRLLLRDIDRLRDWDKRAAISPTPDRGRWQAGTLGMDPRRTAAALGFLRLRSSIDGTAACDVIA